MAGGAARVDEHQYLTRQGAGVNISIESEASANPAGHFYPRCYATLMRPVALERCSFHRMPCRCCRQTAYAAHS